MRATELQIGDWVLKDMNWSEEDPLYSRLDYQLYQIESGDDIDLACENNCIGDGSIYQPIPLTPEILEKNGFEQKTDGWLRCEDKANEFQNYIFIQYRHQGDIRECEINYVNIVKANYLYIINYVHELQHALRLCGLPELADNFKVE